MASEPDIYDTIAQRRSESAYQDAVSAINAVVQEASPYPMAAQQQLTALKALIDLELAKLPPDQPDYTEEEN